MKNVTIIGLHNNGRRGGVLACVRVGSHDNAIVAGDYL